MKGLRGQKEAEKRQTCPHETLRRQTGLEKSPKSLQRALQAKTNSKFLLLPAYTAISRIPPLSADTAILKIPLFPARTLISKIPSFSAYTAISKNPSLSRVHLHFKDSFIFRPIPHRKPAIQNNQTPRLRLSSFPQPTIALWPIFTKRP